MDIPENGIENIRKWNLKEFSFYTRHPLHKTFQFNPLKSLPLHAQARKFKSENFFVGKRGNSGIKYRISV